MTTLPAHLQGRERRNLAASVASGLAGLSAPYVSINGGQFNLVDAAGDTIPLRSVTLDCVILDALDRTSRVFWGVGENGRPLVPDPANPAPPICFSDNGQGASANAQEPQSASCAGCQWNQWGSAISNRTGQGVKACGSTKKVAVYVAQHPKHPFLLRVPIMSHDALGKYAAMFAGQDFGPEDLWTRVTIVPQGIGFSLTFEPSYKHDASKGFVDEATAATCDAWIKARLTDQLIGRGDPPWTGTLAAPQARPALPASTPAAQVPAQPAAQPAAAPAPAFALPPAPPAAAAPAAPARAPRKPRGSQAQNQPPAAAPGQPPNWNQAPAAPAPEAPRAAPFGVATAPVAPPPSNMQDALNKAFGLPT